MPYSSIRACLNSYMQYGIFAETAESQFSRSSFMKFGYSSYALKTMYAITKLTAQTAGVQKSA